MPEKVYKKVVADDGTETFQEVEVPTAEELAAVKEKLAQANREAMERRHELNAIKNKPAATAVDAEVQDQPQATPTAANTPVQQVVPLDEDAIVAKAVAQLEQKQSQAAQKERELRALLDKHNLPDRMLGVLKQSLDPVAAAEELGQAVLTFAGSNTGQVKRGNNVSDAAKAAFKDLNLEWE